MKKGFKKIMAYFCAIALIVTSVTVYNNKSVSAYEDSEYTALTNGKGAAVGDCQNYLREHMMVLQVT